MTTEELLMEVVRMLREREDYYDAEHLRAVEREDGRAACLMLGKALAYDTAREMLMAALTNNMEILRQYDYFGQNHLDNE